MKDLAILFAACTGAILLENEDTARANLGALLLSGTFFTVMRDDRTSNERGSHALA